MGSTIIGLNNLIGNATLLAGSAATNMSVINLKIDSGAPSQAWQTVAGVLTAAAGANFRITTTKQLWRVFGLFRTNLTQGASVTFSLYINPSTLVWSGTVTGPVPGYGQVIAVAPADTLADYCIVNINDTTNPDGFINVPLCYAGPGWIPELGQTWNSTYGRDAVVDEMISRGGQEYPTYRYQQRRWEADFDAISRSELWASAQELDRVSRLGGNMLFVPDRLSSTISQEAVFGRVTVTSDVAWIPGVGDRFRWKFRCKERL